MHDSATRSLSGVIICPANRTAVIWRTPSPFSSYGQPNKSQAGGMMDCGVQTNSLMWDRLRLHLCFRRILDGHNAPIGADREKAVPARSAPIGGKMKQPEQPGERACPVLAGNALEIHVAALAAMRVPNIRDGNGPRIKTQIAAPAAPGPQQSDPNQIVLHAPPAGTARGCRYDRPGKAILFLPWEEPSRSIREGCLARQVPSVTC